MKRFHNRNRFCYYRYMRVLIGIDEVGRGPLAGPVAVCALKLKAKSYNLKAVPVPLRDSKKLTRAQRELWFTQIKIWQKEGKCDFAVVMISAKMIDKIGIAPAIGRALARALYRLKTIDYRLPILLDGGLRAPDEFKNQKTIIKGDESEPIISLASIAAKVTRDRYMLSQHKKFPEYGFDSHVGYGTRKHYAAIKEYGLCDLHRRSFLKKVI